MTTPQAIADALQGAQVAVVRPGDTLIISFGRTLPADEMRAIADQMRQSIPDTVCIMFVDQVTGMAVVRPDELA